MANTTFNILPSIDGKQYSQYPAGNYIPAPTGLTANVAGSFVTLDFTDNTLGLATNILRRSTSPTGTYSDVATLPPGTTHYVDAPSTSGTYYYQVTAYFNGSPSATSNTATGIVTTVVAPTLAAPAMTSDGASISFSGGSGYTTLIPQYSSNAGATWTSIANDTASPLTYSGLAAGAYSFRALADGSLPTNVVTGTVASGAALINSYSLTETVDPTAKAANAGTFWADWNGYNGATKFRETATVNGVSGTVLRIHQPVNGGGNTFGYLRLDVSALNTQDIYIDFWAKMTPRGGLKFLKLFGSSAGDFPHTTFQPDWNSSNLSAPNTGSGRMGNVTFGDGSSAGLDNSNIINFDCVNKTSLSPSAGYSNVVGAGRSGSTATILTPQAAAWNGWDDGLFHHFRVRVKYNTGTSAGTEVKDGAYFVEIDGLVYCDASGLFNRHYSDGQFHKWVDWFGYAQNNNYVMDISVANIKVATAGWPA